MGFRASLADLPVVSDGLAGAGRRTREAASRSLELLSFTGAVLRAAMTYPPTATRAATRSMVNQVRFTAVQALLFVGTIALLIGVTVIVQAHAQAVRLGLAETLGRILATVVIRELGPLLTAVIVLGRSGTAIAAELATDRALGETDALEALGVDPLQYLVVPRIAAAAISVMLLTIYFNAITLFGGALAAALLGQVSLAEYVASLRLAMSMGDLWVTLAKGLLFGAGIATVCSCAGLTGGRKPTDIPKSVTRGVVISLLFIFAVSAAFSVALYT